MTDRLASPTRRGFFFGAAALFAGQAALAPRPAAQPVVITVLGDSLTAGRGLSSGDTVAAQLQAELRRRGANVVVRGAGVGGDTSAGGLARADFSVRPDTGLVIIELGANDLLQGLPPEAMERNLTALIRKFKAKGMKVLLCTVRAPAIINQNYASRFNAVWDDIAQREGVPLHRNFLQGVAGNPSLNLPDHMHPNAQGVKIVVSRLADDVMPVLR